MDVGLCLKQRNTWMDKNVYMCIRRAGIANIPSTHRGCRSKAKHAIYYYYTLHRVYMMLGLLYKLNSLLIILNE